MEADRDFQYLVLISAGLFVLPWPADAHMSLMMMFVVPALCWLGYDFFRESRAPSIETIFR